MAKRTCSVEGCDRDTVAKGWCDRHYRIAKRNGGDPLAAARASGWRQVCVDAPCDREVRRDGRCAVHAVRAERGLPPDASTRQLRGGLEEACAHPECEDPRVSGGYCDKHYTRLRVHGDVDVVKVGGNPRFGPCRIDGCDGQVVGWGLCRSHWTKWRLYGDPEHVQQKHCSWTFSDHPTLGCRVMTIVDTEGVQSEVLYDPIDETLARTVPWYINAGGYAYGPAYGLQLPSTHMVRVMLELEPGDPRVVDHINGRRRDNRRHNLRATTQQRNVQHQAVVNGRGSSRYRGVSWDRSRGLWAAQVKLNGQRNFVGRFATELEAAAAAARFRAAHGMPTGY